MNNKVPDFHPKPTSNTRTDMWESPTLDGPAMGTAGQAAHHQSCRLHRTRQHPQRAHADEQ